MRKQILIPALVGILTLGAAQAFAQSATVVMRNGDRVRADIIDMGADFTFRINGQEQRRPLNDVAMIDFTGDGRNLPVDEVNKASDAGGNGYVVLRNGDAFSSHLSDLTGSPLRAVFSGNREVPLSEVSRVYFTSVRNIPEISASTNPSIDSTTPNPDRPWMRERANRRSQRTAAAAAPSNARTIVVPGNVQWTTAGFNVTRGQYLRFEPSGEIRLSTNGDDVATAAGGRNSRTVDKAQIPSAPVGALIARVGNGQPFVIGDSTQAIEMPASGRLYLSVNDDHLPDNSGNFVVKVWEP
jgi:hypothetical protein